MTDRLDVIILRQRRLGDVLERLAGRIRQQMEVQPHGQDGSVDNIGKMASATRAPRQAGDKPQLVHNSLPSSDIRPQAVENVERLAESPAIGACAAVKLLAFWA